MLKLRLALRVSRSLIYCGAPRGSFAGHVAVPGSEWGGRLRALFAILALLIREAESHAPHFVQGLTIMADPEPTPEQLAAIAAENETCEKVNYKAPAQKTLKEIQELDQEDESLRKYKETLLGSPAITADPSVPNVQVTKMALICDAAPGPLELDLTGDLEGFKNQCFVLKEGVEYRIKVCFKVNKEIVSGLKYQQTTYRKGVRLDKSDYMVGSYGPRVSEHEFLTTCEEAPKGMIARGTYSIKSKFTDDDKNDHLSWEWNLTIKKDWN
ncbi:hypothetical protein GJAV_G00224310 [Gymnothorax javanicus]|nr:hypothetical protein GJAV_G00224310 [Gymnothorax javanicus]